MFVCVSITYPRLTLEFELAVVAKGALELIFVPSSSARVMDMCVPYIRPSILSLSLSWFFKTGFLCVALEPAGTHFLDQAGLKLIEICLSLSPECWN